MAFRFSLEAVLRYRQSLEDRALRHLQVLIMKRAGLTEEIRQLQRTRRLAQDDLSKAMQVSPRSGAELQIAQQVNHGLLLAADQLQTQLGELEKEILQQTERYRVDRQRREVLSSLRETRLCDYQRELRRREQATLDEVALMTRQRRPS